MKSLKVKVDKAERMHIASILLSGRLSGISIPDMEKAEIIDILKIADKLIRVNQSLK